MAKKRKDETIDTSASEELKHNPFAALAGLDAPPADAPAPEAPETSAATEPAAFASKVVVRREKKGRRGKTVTRISGIAAAHREEIATRMKKALGCGATVEDDDVILLGSLVDRAADWLEAEGARRVSRSP